MTIEQRVSAPNPLLRYCSGAVISRARQQAEDLGADPIYLAMIRAAKGDVRGTAAFVLAAENPNGLGLMLVRTAHLNLADELAQSSYSLGRVDGSTGRADRIQVKYHLTQARMLEKYLNSP